MSARAAAIDYLVRRIVELVHPIRIILFGSTARGDIREDSDVDFLVVMPDGTHRRRTSQRLYLEIGVAGVPFDVLVATESDLAKHRDNVGFIYRTILREGRDVYRI
jgi:predicted nucleotidyltransferase